MNILDRVLMCEDMLARRLREGSGASIQDRLVLEVLRDVAERLQTERETRQDVCPVCGSDNVMGGGDMGVCMACGYAWIGGYPCICGALRFQYRSGSGHHSRCPMHVRWLALQEASQSN